jgi:hypothetical protein
MGSWCGTGACCSDGEPAAVGVGPEPPRPLDCRWRVFICNGDGESDGAGEDEGMLIVGEDVAKLKHDHAKRSW